MTETDLEYVGGYAITRPCRAARQPAHQRDHDVVANTITTGPENHLSVSALYDGIIGEPLTTNRSLEISGGAITFCLGPGANGLGYTITNLNTYTAWQDDGREDANYAVSCSSDGTNFFPIATVAYNPSPYPTHDGTGGTLTSLAVANLTGVQYLQWNFSAAQQNGGVGYTEVAAFGQSSLPLIPASLGVAQLAGLTNFVMNISGLSPGHSYTLQSTTNLASQAWSIETNFVASQPAAAFTNTTANCPQKFYRVVAP